MNILRLGYYKIIYKMDTLSYRSKLMLSFVTVIIVPIILISFTTYSITTSLMEQQVESSFSQTLDQVAINLDKRIIQIKEVANLINQDYTTREILTSKVDKEYYDQLQDFKYLDRYFSSLESNFHLYKIRFYIPNDTIYKSEGYSFFSTDELKTVSGMEAGITDYKDTVFWKPTYYQVFKNNNGRYVFSAVCILKDYVTLRNIGVCFVDLLEDELFTSIKEITEKGGTVTTIIDNKGFIVSSEDKTILGNKYDSPYLDKILEEKDNSFKTDNHLILVKRVETPDLILVSDIPLNIIKEETITITKTIFLITLFAIAFAVLLSLRLSSSLSRKLNFLFVAMKKNKSQDSDEFLQEIKLPDMMSYADEIGQLIVTYNIMVQKIKRLIDEVYSAKLHESDARFKVLQAQINPHFLYNILESIKSFISSNKLDQANELIISLGRFYRIGLSKGRDRISIAEELEMTRLYVNMHKISYGNNMELDIQVDEGILPFLIAKFTLQPIVENAINHGFKFRGGKGRITITGNFDGDDIIIQVKDDGIGIEESYLDVLEKGLGEGKLDSNDKQSGYGLYNVNARLRLHHSNEDSLRIYSNPGGGTTVKIIIPQEL